MTTGALRRRLKTIPTFIGTLIVMLAIAPVALPLLVIVDAALWLASRKHWMGVRLYCFALVYLIAEAVGLVALGGVWLMAGFGRSADPLTRWTFAIQQAWAGTLLAAAKGIFGFRLKVSNEEAAGPGPIILMVRHASIVDNLLPAVLVSSRHQIQLKYVLKRELLSDPCLDVAGNRLQNYFVQRGSADSQAELSAIHHLAAGLGVNDGVLIYPEGTRFSKAKRLRALQNLGDSGSKLFDKAKELQHVLPPRIGGPLALLDSARESDVVILTHRGFEGFAHLRDIWSGGLVGTTVEAEFWRIPREQIPDHRSGQIIWLYETWKRIDDWIDESLNKTTPS